MLAVIREPLRVVISPRELQEIDPRWRDTVLALQSLIERDLWTYSSFDVELPPTAFDEGRSLLPLSALFRAPTADELELVARGPDGALRKLTAEQLREVREDASFSLASASWAGQRHRWALHGLLQRGRTAIRRSLRRALAWSIDQWTEQSRARLFGDEEPSIRAGARRARAGLRGAIGLLVGLREMVPALSTDEVVTLLAKERRRFVTRDFVRVSETHRWLRPDGFSLDLALYEPSVLARLLPIMEALHARSPRASERDRYVASVLEDERIEAISPGLGRAVIERIRAREIIAREEDRSVARVEGAIAAARERLAREHPIRSMVSAWLDREARRAAADELSLERSELASRVSGALADEGLEREAFLFDRGIEFERTIAPSLTKELEQKLAPARTFIERAAIWRRSRWVVRRHDPMFEGEPPTYSLERHRPLTVTTARPAWRLEKLALRSMTAWNNGLRWLLVENLALGSLGLRALFAKESFVSRWTVDQETGQIVAGEGRRARTPTLRARLRSLWRGVRDARRAFEARPDTGFVGKSISRWFSRLYNYLLKGAAGTAIVLVAQPALTLLNTAVVLALTATSILWAPVAGALAWASDALLVDRSSTDRRRAVLPIASYLLFDVAAAGIGQSLASLLFGAVVHPILGVVSATTGALRATLRSLYDDLVRAVVVAPLGRVPVNDTTLARRVEGPGLASEHYYQAPPSLVCLVMMARLEHEELSAFERQTRDLILSPQIELQRFCSQVLGPFSAGHAAERASKLVDERTAAHLEALRRKLEPRQAALAAVTTIEAASQIRLSRSDLARTLERVVPMVRDAFERRILPRMTDRDREELWRARALSEGDFEGLARWLLASAFSEEILTPLEDADRALCLQIEHLRASDYLASLREADAIPDDLDRVFAADTARSPRPRPVADSPHPWGALGDPIGRWSEALRLAPSDDASDAPPATALRSA